MPKIVTETLDQVQAREVSWLWPQRIPLHRFTLVQGDPGVGKSFVLAAIIAAFTGKGDLPERGVRQVGRVLVLADEDTAEEVLRPRMELLGADLERVHVMRGFISDDGREVAFNLIRWRDEFVDCIATLKPDLVVVDPIINFSGGIDTNKADQVNELLTPLVRLADRMDFTLLGSLHSNKSQQKALYKGQGSLQYVASARSSFLVADDPLDPEHGEKVLCQVKSNYGRLTPSLNFVFEETEKGPRIRWGDVGKWNANELLMEEGEEFSGGPVSVAKGYLMGWMDVVKGQVDFDELQLLAGRRDISKTALTKARKELGLEKGSTLREKGVKGDE